MMTLLVTWLATVTVASALTVWATRRRMRRDIEALIAAASSRGPVAVPRPTRGAFGRLAASVQQLRAELGQAQAACDACEQRLRDLAERSRHAEQAIEAQGRLRAQMLLSAEQESIGVLSSALAHDFANLFSALRGFVGQIEHRLGPGADCAPLIEKIRLGCEAGMRVIDHVIRLAQANATADRAPADAAAVARQLLSVLPEAVEPSGAITVEPLPVHARAGQVALVIATLCDRSADAPGRQPGRIALSVQRWPADRIRDPALAHRVLVGHPPDAAHACIEVSDPLPAPAIDRLHRMARPLLAPDGPDLALARVARIVGSAGGAVTVSSRPDRGTVVRVHFPLQGGAEAPRSARHGARLLIVDDDTSVTDRLAIGLERHGYDVVAVNDPVDALAAFEEDSHAWDVVVTDHVMPGLTGLDLAARLRAIRADIRVILITAARGGDQDPDLHRPGIDAVLEKPARPDAVADAVRSLFA